MSDSDLLLTTLAVGLLGRFGVNEGGGPKSGVGCGAVVVSISFRSVEL